MRESTRRLMTISWLIVSTLLGSGLSVAAADWSRFRGPNGSGVSLDVPAVPVRWSPTENLSWKVELPGPGSSSPIVVGERVYVTCWSGYGTDRADPGNQEDLRRHLVCLDRHTGHTVWQKTVEAALPEDVFQSMFAEHGYASHTPVSDGQRIYVYFGKTGAMAFDLDGTQLWHTSVGNESDPRGWGSASSPILHNDILIVTATAECEGIVGLDVETGRELWRQQAAGFNATWGTPVLAPVNDQRIDLVIGVPNEIWGFNPNTGKLRWFCAAMQTDSFCSSVIANNGVVYAVEGRGGGAIAIRAGGREDITNSHVIWSARQVNRIGTPIYYEGRIYVITRGVAVCIDAATGKTIYPRRQRDGTVDDSTRLNPEGAGGFTRRFDDNADDDRPFRIGGGFGGDYASPVIANGNIYYVARTGNMFVIKTGDVFSQLAVNRVTDQREDFSATPAVSDGQLFVRSSRHLYCIGSSPRRAPGFKESKAE